MMNKWVVEMHPFIEYLDHKFKHQKTSYSNNLSETKAVPLKELHKELFHPTVQDNKDITQMLEKLGVVAVTRWVVELIDPTNATYPLNH